MAGDIYGPPRELPRGDALNLTRSIMKAIGRELKRKNIELTPDETFNLLDDIMDFLEQICAIEPEEQK